ncbi:MAG: NAD(P)H-hydrate dehydratase [Chthoniobacterales bacterium]
MILTCKEMQTAEERVFKRGISANALMESAGQQIAEAVMQFYPTPGLCLAYCGKGHNAGDALVACHWLREAGWKISLHLIYPRKDIAKLTLKKLSALGTLPKKPETIAPGKPIVILDGILGIGAKGELREPILSAVQEINRLRKKQDAFTVAIDLPTGLDSETGVPADPCVEADLTTAIACAKSCHIADTAINVVGRLAILPLVDLPLKGKDTAEVASPSWVGDLLIRRAFDTHKGKCGRIGIIAGSRGFLGAARLCSGGALRAGAGLVTLYVTEDIYPLVAMSCSPEVMVKPVCSYRAVLEDKLDALAIGPGIGFAHAGDILSLIRDAAVPMTVDADALTILSKDISTLRHCAGARLLTPHPGEMERLDPAAGRTRRVWAEDFASRYPATLLLKGARTLIAEKDKPPVFNSTGHPGMATGGMGDVLTGVTGALLAQGYSCHQTAIIGSWVCGHAAERAVYLESQSAESLIAGDLLDALGGSFDDLRCGCY